MVGERRGTEGDRRNRSAGMGKAKRTHAPCAPLPGLFLPVVTGQKLLVEVARSHHLSRRKAGQRLGANSFTSNYHTGLEGNVNRVAIRSLENIMRLIAGRQSQVRNGRSRVLRLASLEFPIGAEYLAIQILAVTGLQWLAFQQPESSRPIGLSFGT
jgi:hypothetical protein